MLLVRGSTVLLAALPPCEPMTPDTETNAARLIVCERDGHWAAAMRRELGRRGRPRLGSTHAGRLPPRIGGLPCLVRRIADGPQSSRYVPINRQTVARFSGHPHCCRGRTFATRLRAAGTRGRRGPFRLFYSAGRHFGPHGLSPSCPSAVAAIESGRANLGRPALGRLFRFLKRRRVFRERRLSARQQSFFRSEFLNLFLTNVCHRAYRNMTPTTSRRGASGARFLFDETCEFCVVARDFWD